MAHILRSGTYGLGSLKESKVRTPARSSEFYAPNSKQETLERWRRDGRMRAIGAITWRGGTISGKELAAILGVSPRALRNLLVYDGHFLVEYRAQPGKKDEAWYRIKPESVEPPKELPPIRREALPDGGKTPRIRYSGGPTPAIERFSAVPRITAPSMHHVAMSRLSECGRQASA